MSGESLDSLNVGILNLFKLSNAKNLKILNCYKTKRNINIDLWVREIEKEHSKRKKQRENKNNKIYSNLIRKLN